MGKNAASAKHCPLVDGALQVAALAGTEMNINKLNISI